MWSRDCTCESARISEQLKLRWIGVGTYERKYYEGFLKVWSCLKGVMDWWSFVTAVWIICCSDSSSSQCTSWKQIHNSISKQRRNSRIPQPGAFLRQYSCKTPFCSNFHSLLYKQTSHFIMEDLDNMHFCQNSSENLFNCTIPQSTNSKIS